MAFPAGESELRELVLFLHEVGAALNWTVLGGGANLFADSAGYDGVVVSLKHWSEPLSLDKEGVLVVPGGMDLRFVAEEAARRGWGGVDWMAVVPGTIGGAVCINAGTAYEGYVADRLLWAESMSPEGRLRRWSAEEMGFGYRVSRLLGQREIVVRAGFRLASVDSLGTTPDALFARFEEAMAARRAKFPLDLPNFGSTFRSPGAEWPPAGRLLDELGMKGLRLGNAQISEMHANFIVNLGNASSEDVIGLMERMRDAVQKRHGIILRPEVHFLHDGRRSRPEIFG
jgi:UDP-N-acetylmuramate dehydrogenase